MNLALVVVAILLALVATAMSAFALIDSNRKVKENKESIDGVESTLASKSDTAVVVWKAGDNTGGNPSSPVVQWLGVVGAVYPQAFHKPGRFPVYRDMRLLNLAMYSDTEVTWNVESEENKDPRVVVDVFAEAFDGSRDASVPIATLVFRGPEYTGEISPSSVKCIAFEKDAVGDETEPQGFGDVQIFKPGDDTVPVVVPRNSLLSLRADFTGAFQPLSSNNGTEVYFTLYSENM